MPTCPKCGAEVNPEARFCNKCGANLARTAQPVVVTRRHEADVLGAVSVGMILIILAVTYLVHPIDLSIVTRYIGLMGRQGTWIKPPLILFDPIIFFFNMVAIWSIALSGLRVVWERSVRKAINDLAGGGLSFLIAYLLTNYRDDVLSGRTTLALLIVGIGALVLFQAVISPYFRRRYA